MDFLFQNCLVAAENFSASRAGQLLGDEHGMACVVLDHQKLHAEVQKRGRKAVLARYLSGREQEKLEKFISDKRQREWFGGRIAAKYVTAKLLLENDQVPPWRDLAVLGDENGRPFLALAERNTVMPDISISHSGGLAAAMAVGRGRCGIDIQRFSGRVLKVRERFCTAEEERLLRSSFASHPQTAVLTRLWAAKEALRKVVNSRSLPGFLDLNLMVITKDSTLADQDLRLFIIAWKHLDINGNPTLKKCRVVVSPLADYALALTTMDDIVD